MLTMEKKRIGAYVGMSGYFPFMRDLERLANDSVNAGGGTDKDEKEESDGDAINFEMDNDSENGISFGNEDNEDAQEILLNKPARAVNFFRENIGLLPLTGKDALAPACLQIPVFLAHGAKDEKLPIINTWRVRDALIDLGMDVTWKEYGDLGRWYMKCRTKLTILPRSSSKRFEFEFTKYL